MSPPGSGVRALAWKVESDSTLPPTAGGVPTGRGFMQATREIADSVVFFASDLSRVVTGQALDVNGGHFFH